MVKVAWSIPRLNAGEFSPLMDGRIDYEARQASCKKLLNAYPLIQGPVTRRGGTRFVSEVKDSSKKTIIVEFEYSVEQAYILEFGEKYMRAFRNYAPVYDTKTVEGAETKILLEIETPYLEAELSELFFCQKNDILFIAHRNHKTRQLIRKTQTKFELSELPLVDGPYLPTHTGETTLQPMATTGDAVVVNAGAEVFAVTDVGRLLRLEHTANSVVKIGYGEIVEFVNAKTVKLKVKEAFQNTATTKAWRLGAFSKTTGYASAIAFHEQRLVLANGQGIGFSKNNNHESFAPTDYDGTVKAVNGFFIEIAADNKSHNIQWLSSDEVLFVGAVGADFVVSSNTLQDALTAANARAMRISNYGSEKIRPVKIDDATVFVQRMGRKVRCFVYGADSGKYQGLNMTGSANHIAQSGLIAAALTQEPTPIVWYARKDGVLIGCTFDREQTIVAWHRHLIGGNGKSESLAAIPSADMSRDDLYLIVNRTINGQTKRYIEYLEKGIDEEATDCSAARFLDCGVLLTSPAPKLVWDGLEHLEGMKIEAIYNNGFYKDIEVINGAITLVSEATEVYAGLGFETVISVSSLSPGDDNGTSEGKKKRISSAIVKFYKTLFAKAGTRETELEEISFLEEPIINNSPSQLFSGEKNVSISGGWNSEASICIKQDTPAPLTVLGIYPVISINKS